jgi:hypothetical protein
MTEGDHDEDRLSHLREKIRYMVGQWKDSNFDTTFIEEVLQTENDHKILRAVFKDFRRKINTLKELEVELRMLDRIEHRDRVREIMTLIHNPAKIDFVKKKIWALKKEINEKEGGPEKKPRKIKRTVKVKDTLLDDDPEDQDQNGVDLSEFEIEDTEVEKRGIDLYLELVCAIIHANKGVLTLETLRMVQRMMKIEYPRMMFFSILRSFNIDSVMPDDSESCNALKAFLERLHAYLESIVGLEKATEMLRTPGEKFILKKKPQFRTVNINEFLPFYLRETE